MSVRNSDVFMAARALQSRGDFAAAARMLQHECDTSKVHSESTLEHVRLLLRMGHVNRASETIERLRVPDGEPGLAARLSVERVWISMLRSFDVAAALKEADRVWLAAQGAGLQTAELADAQRTHLRIVRAAAIYRELSNDRELSERRKIDARSELAKSAGALFACGWSQEGAAAFLMFADWVAADGASSDELAKLAAEFEQEGRLDGAAQAWVMEAERLLKARAPTPEIQAAADASKRLASSIGHQPAWLDAVHVETKLRIDRRGAPSGELADLVRAYGELDMPVRQLSVLADLSVFAHHQGDLQAALSYRRQELTIAESSGIQMTVIGGQLALAELLMRSRHLTEAIEVCEAALREPLPRVMLGTFEQFLATCYSFAGNRVRAGWHLGRAITLYDAVGADDFASVAVTKEINDSLSSGNIEVLAQSNAKAFTWAARDIERADFEAAASKYQMRAQIALRLNKITGDATYLAAALSAARDAEEASGHLTGQIQARELGNIAQLEAQIALGRGDTAACEAAHRHAVQLYEDADLGLQAANSRYIIGCLRLNASADSARAGDHSAAADHFGEAETMLKAALDYYERNDMRNESASAHRMLAQLFVNGRVLAPQGIADQMRVAALERLDDAEASLDAMRAELELKTRLETQQAKQAIVATSAQVYELAKAILGERQDDVEQLWVWHQRSRTRALADGFGLAGFVPSSLAALEGSRPDLAQLLKAEKELLAGAELSRIKQSRAEP